MTGRRALVGGASSGLGLAIADKLAADGADLLLWSRDSARLEPAAATLRQKYPSCTVQITAADAGDPDAAEQIAAIAVEVLGGVDILILNAGGPPPCAPDSTTADAWRSALQLLTITPIDLATRLLPGMRKNHWGRIVSVMSSGIREPLPDLAYSNGGRSALAAWMKTVSSAVAADGVTVNGVLPGRIDTDRIISLDGKRAEREGITAEAAKAKSEATIPMQRYGRPEEFAAVTAFLASEAASYVTGSFLSCDGGLGRGTW